MGFLISMLIGAGVAWMIMHPIKTLKGLTILTGILFIICGLLAALWAHNPHDGWLMVFWGCLMTIPFRVARLFLGE